MVGLLLKDLHILKGQKKFLYIILIVGVMTFLSGVDSSFLIGYITFMFVMFSLTTLTYDEYENGMQFLLTLPFIRKAYVAEKYLFSISAAIIGGIFGILFSFILKTINSNFTIATGVELFGVFASDLFLMGVVIMLTIPLVIKFGAEKGRVLLISAICCISLAIYGSIKVFRGFVSLEQITSFCENNSIILMILGILIYILGFIISYHSSRKILEEKEF